MTPATTNPKLDNLLTRACQQLVRLPEFRLIPVIYADLLGNLWGKNTKQAARIIAKMFIDRFGETYMTADILSKRICPHGRAKSWSGLKDTILNICRCDKPLWELNMARQNIKSLDCPDEELFYMAAVDVINALPKVLDTKNPITDPEKILFTTCKLCWRPVPRLIQKKKIHLCHVHDIPCNSTEYRKRKHLLPFVKELQEKLSREIPMPYQIKEAGQRADEYYLNLCLDINGPLSYLATYLKTLKTPLNGGEDILRALYGPVYWEKLEGAVRQAWESYLADYAICFEINHKQLKLAEAWLRAEAEHKHGGVRLKREMTSA